jgi:type II secretory pathway component PulM
MRALFARLRALLARLPGLLENLSPRERLLVSAVGAVAVACALVVAVLELLDAGDRIDARVAAAEQELEVLARLRREYDDVSLRLRSVEERIQKAPSGNLRTTLESLAQRASVRIESMEPQASPTHERYRETKVEVGLREVTLAQAVSYLHQIEQTPQPLSVKALRIRTRPEKPELLDVTFSVSSFEPL